MPSGCSPKILILDDTAPALDAESEILVHTELRKVSTLTLI